MGSERLEQCQSVVEDSICQNTIRNGNFESGASNWQEYSAHGWPIIANFPGERVRG